MAAISQNYARKHQVSIDSLQFKYEIINNLFDESEVDVKTLFESSLRLNSDILIKDTVFLCGFYFDGGKWDREQSCIYDSPQRFTPVPHFLCRLIKVP